MQQAAQRAVRGLTRVELVAFVVLLVVLAGVNVANVAFAVTRALASSRSPSASSTTVLVNEFPPLVFELCIPTNFQPTIAPAFALSVAYYNTVDEYLADVQLPRPATNRISRALASYASEVTDTSPDSYSGVDVVTGGGNSLCGRVDLPMSLMANSASFVTLEALSSNGAAFFRVLSARQAAMASRQSMAGGVALLASGATYALRLARSLYFNRAKQLMLETLDSSLQLSYIGSLSGATNVTRIQLFIGNVNFQETRTTEFVSYSSLDAVVTIVSVFSISMALVRALFPILPIGERARVFVLGSGRERLSKMSGADVALEAA